VDPHGRRQLERQDGQYVQGDVAAENTMVSAGDPAWHDYDLR
jgi:hypothetical protein